MGLRELDELVNQRFLVSDKRGLLGVQVWETIHNAGSEAEPVVVTHEFVLLSKPFEDRFSDARWHFYAKQLADLMRDRDGVHGFAREGAHHLEDERSEVVEIGNTALRT